MFKVDAEVQRLSAPIEADVSTWRGVTVKAMFGMRAFYRGAAMFAAVPWTRAMRNANSLIVKLPNARQRHAELGRGPGADWATFALESAADVPPALAWIGKAYERARATKAPRRATSPKGSR